MIKKRANCFGFALFSFSESYFDFGSAFFARVFLGTAAPASAGGAFAAFGFGGFFSAAAGFFAGFALGFSFDSSSAAAGFFTTFCICSASMGAVGCFSVSASAGGAGCGLCSCLLYTYDAAE